MGLRCYSLLSVLRKARSPCHPSSAARPAGSTKGQQKPVPEPAAKQVGNWSAPCRGGLDYLISILCLDVYSHDGAGGRDELLSLHSWADSGSISRDVLASSPQPGKCRHGQVQGSTFLLLDLRKEPYLQPCIQLAKHKSQIKTNESMNQILTVRNRAARRHTHPALLGDQIHYTDQRKKRKSSSKVRKQNLLSLPLKEESYWTAA